MSDNTPLAPRGSTITWGAILLLVASVVAITAVFGSWSWSTVAWLVVAFGALMVVAGLIGGISRAIGRGRTRSASTDRLTEDST
ncbi:protein-S-isoprenylcysteine O-methyltransferase Ste14 [Microbacteriaceae bacterium SG_E_30_P1]|uniref:Protein-S-isoprenylcysteine O-methyltransferase Ste14 n=1 Tax=Antiquaquibacter oligotrophicus TaxID=2880260 RepID=A0ABT6KPP5_9MICO|nr:hypothetical protein [Antiquaquibacter oligotrophicus]MDH6181971.1 protein-S-isoprenylcysteine O-methyltransferase Ste14 [Antiquaquibacter oligotrophicus]UDF12360.1 hypothetical protein LH407_09320 [Antiquaquibacter oligotrophicus]